MPSRACLPPALRCGFAYIDGWHTFDYCLLDWWYIDKMLDTDGIVGFNDCGFPAVDKVIRFLLSHRQYREINVGLPVTHNGNGHRFTFRTLSRLAHNRHPPPRLEDRYFQKITSAEPAWNFFSPF